MSIIAITSHIPHQQPIYTTRIDSEKHEHDKNWTKALKHYRNALEGVNQILSDSSEKSQAHADLKQLAKELNDRMLDMDALINGRMRSSSVSADPGRKRSSSTASATAAVPPEPRSRAGTAVGLPAEKPPEPAPGARDSVTNPKKEKDSHVRFVEQKKLYFYSETTPPTETLLIQNGFVTALGLLEEEFAPLYRDLVHCIVLPLHSSPPDTAPAMTKHLRLAFNLSEAEHDDLLDAEYTPSDALKDLLLQLKHAEKHSFYAFNTFKDEDDFNKWLDGEEARVTALVKNLRAKSPEAQVDEADLEESEDRKPKKKKKKKPKKPKHDDDSETSNDQSESSSEDQVAPPPRVGTSPLRYDLLFRILVARELAGPRASENRATKLQPLYKKLEELIDGVALDAPIEIDDDLLTGAEGKKWEDLLFILSKHNKWILEEFGERYGFSAVYKLLVRLSWVISVLSTDIDKLVMVHLLLRRILNLFQDDDYIYNKRELFFFQRIMKELNREVQQYVFNIFRHFTTADLLSLKVLIKVVLIMFECNEFVALSDELNFEDFMIKAAEESIKNKYKDIIAETEESRDPQIGDPIGTNNSAALRRRQKTERRLSADQLIQAFDLVVEQLETIDDFAEVFPPMEQNLSDMCCESHLKQLFSDVKLFAMKFANTNPTTQVLTLGLRIKEVNKKFVKNREGIDELPVEYLFGPFVERWLEESEENMRTWVTATCKAEQWQPIDPKAKKLWSYSAEELYKLCADPIPFVKQNESMILGLEENAETLLQQYGKVMAKAIKDYVEHLYNLFVDEFPTELHSDLHDLYIREYYINLTSTGGSGAGGLQVSYAKKKRSFVDLFKRKPTSSSSSSSLSLDTDLDPASLRFATLRGSPKLGRSNAVADNIKGRTYTLSGSPSTKTNPLATLSKDQRDYGIKVWNRVLIDPDKVKKLKKARKALDLTARMCVKLNDLETIRVQFEALIKKEEDLVEPLDNAFVLLKKVYSIFINMIVYVMNLYIESEIGHMFSKCKKKPSKEAASSVYGVSTYINHNLLVMHANLKLNIFKRILLRIWKVAQEDVMDVMTKEDGSTEASLAQICVVEDLMEAVKPHFVKYGMSIQHLAQKIGELLALATQNVNSDALGAVRVSYQEEKDKLEKKKGKEMLKVKSSNTLLDSSREDDDVSDARETSNPGGMSATNSEKGADLIDSDGSNSSSDQDDSAFPPAKKSAEKPRVEKLLEKKDPEPDRASRSNTATGLPIFPLKSDSFTDANKPGRKKPIDLRIKTLTGVNVDVDTDHLKAMNSETDDVAKNSRYNYSDTERESATERDVTEDEGEVKRPKRGSRRPYIVQDMGLRIQPGNPPVLKIVAEKLEAIEQEQNKNDKPSEEKDTKAEATKEERKDGESAADSEPAKPAESAATKDESTESKTTRDPTAMEPKSASPAKGPEASTTSASTSPSRTKGSKHSGSISTESEDDRAPPRKHGESDADVDNDDGNTANDDLKPAEVIRPVAVEIVKPRAPRRTASAEGEDAKAASITASTSSNTSSTPAINGQPKEKIKRKKSARKKKSSSHLEVSDSMEVSASASASASSTPKTGRKRKSSKKLIASGVERSDSSSQIKEKGKTTKDKEKGKDKEKKEKKKKKSFKRTGSSASVTREEPGK